MSPQSNHVHARYVNGDQCYGALGSTGDSTEEQWLIENNNHLMLRERKKERKKRKTVEGGMV